MGKSWISDPKTVLLTCLSGAVGAAIGWFFMTKAEPAVQAAVPVPEPVPVVADCSYRIDRIGSYKFTRPLFQAERDCEAQVFLPLKAALTQHIDTAMKAGRLLSASVYLRSFGKGQWMAVNNGPTYAIGELSRLPMMITWLHVYREGQRSGHPLPLLTVGPRNLDSLLMMAGDAKDTTVISAMAAQVTQAQWDETFDEIGLKAPVGWRNTTSNAHDFAGFMKLVFNSNWLGPEDSDRLLGALERDRADTMLGGIHPASVAVCGLSHDRPNNDRWEVHECGIVLEDNGPYLLVVMTEAKEESEARDLVRWVLERVKQQMRSGTSQTGDQALRIG